MPNAIVHFEVLGKDKAVLEDFYRAAFDWQLNSSTDHYSMASPGTGINGGIGTAMDGGSGYATFYVEVANIAETLSVIEGRGGQKTLGRPVDARKDNRGDEDYHETPQKQERR